MNDNTDDMFRALVENSPDVIVRYDLEGRRRYANPAWVRLTGHDFGEILGRTVLERPMMPDPGFFHQMLMGGSGGSMREKLNCC
ncbi:PAS domain S-box protein [Nitrincola sp. MINF-07-Sa-05]|uniref:PAS domain S-box protein n=1 Tax=Nitrincola salilacus TaxID=3400273 RepID=UPI003918389C